MSEDEISKAVRQFGVKIRSDLLNEQLRGIPVGDPRRVLGSQQPEKSELMPLPKKPKPRG